MKSCDRTWKLTAIGSHYSILVRLKPGEIKRCIDLWGLHSDRNSIQINNFFRLEEVVSNGSLCQSRLEDWAHTDPHSCPTNGGIVIKPLSSKRTHIVSPDFKERPLPLTKSSETGLGSSTGSTVLLSGIPQMMIWVYCYKWNWQSAFAGFHQFQRPTWARFWEGIQWMSRGEQCLPLCRLSPKLVTANILIVQFKNLNIRSPYRRALAWPPTQIY